MNAVDVLHLSNKLDMILSEVDDVKQMLIAQQMEKYREAKGEEE
jgi:hypothetical protein